MKRLILFCLFLPALQVVKAQNIWDANGNVGIGLFNPPTDVPQARLDLGQYNGVKQLVYGGAGNSGYFWGFGVNLGHSANEASIFIGGATGSCCGAENFSVISADQSAWPYSTYTNRLTVNSRTGNVGIGTLNINDGNYKLFVETGIRTRKIVVDQLGWPDYVFRPGYNRLSLDSVESYIRAHQHLPDLTPADSVEKNGLNLGDTQAELTKKVEELTLYILDLKKEIDLLKQENEKYHPARNSKRH